MFRRFCLDDYIYRIWGEKKYMTLNNNDMLLKNVENVNGIEETQIKLKKHEWKIIGNKKMWRRICPCCEQDVWHVNRASVYRKTNINRLCRNCWSKQKIVELQRKCPTCCINITYKVYKSYWSAEDKKSLCRSCSKIGNYGRKGQKNTEEHKQKVGNKHRGKKTSESAKCKMREAALRRIKSNNIRPYTNYNPVACKYFHELNIQNNWNLQHALNGGEIQVIGYSLDAYDKENNIVVEYDEPLHEKPSIKTRDIIRQQKIIEHLNCKFYRYSEKFQTFKLVSNQND